MSISDDPSYKYVLGDSPKSKRTSPYFEFSNEDVEGFDPDEWRTSDSQTKSEPSSSTEPDPTISSDIYTPSSGDIIIPDITGDLKLDVSDWIILDGVRTKSGRDVAISPFGIFTNDYTSKPWKSQFMQAFDDGIVLATLPMFGVYLKSLINAHDGSGNLRFVSGSPVPSDKIDSYFNDLLVPYSKKPSKGRSLDACFSVDSSGKRKMFYNHRQTHSDLTPETNSEISDFVLKNDCYADISSLDELGLPHVKSGKDYIAGETLYYWKVINNRVCRFWSYDGISSLDCDNDQGNVNPSLGVFGAVSLSAGGAQIKN